MNPLHVSLSSGIVVSMQFDASRFLDSSGSLLVGVSIEALREEIDRLHGPDGTVEIVEYLDASVAHVGLPKASADELSGVRTEESIFTFDDPLPAGVSARIRFERAQMADRPNRNNRIYEFDSMVEACEEADKEAKRGDMVSFEAHPGFFTEPSMSDIAARVCSVVLDKKTGHVEVVLDVIENSTGGDAVVRLVRVGGSIRVSSRARGRVSVEAHYQGKFGAFGKKPKKGDEDKYIDKPLFVIKDFRFQGWDFVANEQAVPGAIHRPGTRKANLRTRESLASSVAMVDNDVATESVDDQRRGEEMEPITIETLRKSAPDLLKQVQQEALASQTAELVEARKQLAAMRESSDLAEARRKIEVLTTERDALRVTVESAKSSGSAPSPQPVVEVADPEKVALRAELEALRRDARLSEMTGKAQARLTGGRYRYAASVLIPLVVSEGHVPKDDADLETRCVAVEGLVESILAAKTGNDLHPLHPQTTRVSGRPETTSESLSTSRYPGDDESADAFN